MITELNNKAIPKDTKDRDLLLSRLNERAKGTVSLIQKFEKDVQSQRTTFKK